LKEENYMNYFLEKMKKIFVILFAGLLFPAGLQAQKVYKDGTKVILDLTVAAGMPASAVTTDSKTAQYAGANPVNAVIHITNNLEREIINATVFQKLEIALSDLKNGSTETFNWATAFTTCRSLSHNGSSDWRLPTQRELMLIWIFRPALESVLGSITGGSNFTNDSYYWGATESGASNASNMIISSGYIYHISKENLYRARCVREVN
jgi:hypothetical protein